MKTSLIVGLPSVVNPNQAIRHGQRENRLINRNEVEKKSPEYVVDVIPSDLPLRGWQFAVLLWCWFYGGPGS